MKCWVLKYSEIFEFNWSKTKAVETLKYDWSKNKRVGFRTAGHNPQCDWVSLLSPLQDVRSWEESDGISVK